MNPEITYGTMTDTRDGKTYKTIKIGDQTWMAENLNYSDSTKTPSLKGKSWCYDNEDRNCDVTGRLYTWAAAIDSVKLATDATNPLDCGFLKTCSLPAKVQGVCPTGWHLPNNTEWNTLREAVGGGEIAGNVLKSQTGWDDGGNGTDSLGFSALPAGRANCNGTKYCLEGNRALFWSTDDYNDYESIGYTESSNVDDAYIIELEADDDIAWRTIDEKYVGLSVRCLMD